MRISVFNKIVGSFTLFLLLLMSAPMHAVAASPTVLKAKQEGEAKGYIFFTTHDEIVGMAKKEGKLRVMSGLEPTAYKPLINAFKQKYPFITDIHVGEIQGTDAYQRFILELQAGRVKEWDIAHLVLDFAKEYTPYLMKYDIVGMAKQGVLKIDTKMIHPAERNIVGVTSVAIVTPYNRKLISEDKVPAQWEDFLKPEFKGKKFVMNIDPETVAGMVPTWGLEKTLDFARTLAAQQPVWGQGGTRINTAIAVGEYPLGLSTYFHVVKRAMSKDPTGNLSYKIIEPVSTNVIKPPSAILNTADHPHAALLWYEFLASPEGQEIIDKYDARASVFTLGSVHEQMTRGKKLSLIDWDHSTKFQEYMEKTFAAFGFPKADK